MVGHAARMSQNKDIPPLHLTQRSAAQHASRKPSRPADGNTFPRVPTILKRVFMQQKAKVLLQGKIFSFADLASCDSSHGSLMQGNEKRGEILH